MEMIQLKNNFAHEYIPTAFEFMDILYYRDENPSNENQKLFLSLQKGYLGELELLQFIKEYGLDHWRTITNYWGDYNGRFESDVILLTSMGCYIFEVKNYAGKFEYRGGHSYIDGNELTSDCVFQTRRSYKNIRNLVQGEIPRSNVHGVLAFVGEHSDVFVDESVDDIHVVKRSGLKRFIQDIAREDHSFSGRGIPVQKIVRKLEGRAVSNPFQMDPLAKEEVEVLNKGIACSVCRNFDVRITRKFVSCSCGNVENRRDAMVRTICEYGTLTYDRPLVCRDLYSFFGDDTSYTFLNMILKTYFTREGNGNSTCYVNNGTYLHTEYFSG